MRPCQAGKCLTLAEQPHPAQPSPALLEEQSTRARNGPGMCAQAKADRGPAGRGRARICGLITARLDYQGWRSCHRFPVREHIGVLEVVLKAVSSWLVSPGPPRELPQPVPRHSPHPPDRPPTPFCSPGFNFVPETFTASKSTIRAPSPVLSSEHVGVLKKCLFPFPKLSTPIILESGF